MRSRMGRSDAREVLSVRCCAISSRQWYLMAPFRGAGLAGDDTSIMGRERGVGMNWRRCLCQRWRFGHRTCRRRQTWLLWWRRLCSGGCARPYFGWSRPLTAASEAAGGKRHNPCAVAGPIVSLQRAGRLHQLRRYTLIVIPARQTEDHHQCCRRSPTASLKSSVGRRSRGQGTVWLDEERRTCSVRGR